MSQTANLSAAPPAVLLSRVGKSYGDSRILSDFDLSVPRGIFLSLLGPSGSGKSTLLRCVGGLEQIGQGRIEQDGRVVDQPGSGQFVPPKDRDLGFVFQNYALWPHLNVLDHVLFPLRQKRIGGDRASQRRRALEALESVGLAGFEQRFPSELSGGQQQRVSLARAIAARPSLILLDEPLSNLDANLRLRLREEVARTHRLTGATYIYVTHDQEEALALSDLVGIVHEGRLLQLAPPDELVNRPADATVASFIGYENILGRADLGEHAAAFLARPPAGAGADIQTLAFRAADISIVPSERHHALIGEFPVARGADSGRARSVELAVGGGAVRAELDWPLLRGKHAIERLSEGETVSLWADPERIVAFNSFHSRKEGHLHD